MVQGGLGEDESVKNSGSGESTSPATIIVSPQKRHMPTDDCSTEVTACETFTPAPLTPPAQEQHPMRRKRGPTDNRLLAQLLEEQRQLRYSLERSREREFDLRERQLVMQERAAEREERFITVLSKFCEK